MTEKYPQWIDEYTTAAYKLLKSHDANSHMPFNAFNLYPYFADLWVDKFYQAIQKFNESGLSTDEILEVLPVTSSMKFNLVKLVWDFPFAKADKKTVRTVADFFVEAISARAVRDRFTQAANIVHTSQEIAELLKEVKPVPINLEKAKALARITTGTSTLVNGLYNDLCTDYGYETYGPYSVDDQYGPDHTLLIRYFPDIKPLALWPEMKDFPYKSITTYSVYKNIECQMLLIGCHLMCEQNLLESITHFQVKVDDRYITSLDDLNEIKDVLLAKSPKFYDDYLKLGFEKHKEIYLKQECYQYKDFFTKMGLDWQPSAEMYQRVKGKKLTDDITTYDVSLEEYKKMGINYLVKAYQD